MAYAFIYAGVFCGIGRGLNRKEIRNYSPSKSLFAKSRSVTTSWFQKIWNKICWKTTQLTWHRPSGDQIAKNAETNRNDRFRRQAFKKKSFDVYPEPTVTDLYLCADPVGICLIHAGVLIGNQDTAHMASDGDRIETQSEITTNWHLHLRNHNLLTPRKKIWRTPCVHQNPEHYRDSLIRIGYAFRRVFATCGRYSWRGPNRKECQRSFFGSSRFDIALRYIVIWFINYRDGDLLCKWILAIVPTEGTY